MTMRNPIDFEKPSHQLNDVLFDALLNGVYIFDFQPFQSKSMMIFLKHEPV